MTTPDTAAHTAPNLQTWRNYLAAHPTITNDDLAELESNLLDRIEDLESQGLDPDEAFLIAVKRFGAQHEVCQEFAQVHSERLWKQLVVHPTTSPTTTAQTSHGTIWQMLAVAIACGLLVRASGAVVEWLDDIRPNNHQGMQWLTVVVFACASVVTLPLVFGFARLRNTVRSGVIAIAVGLAMLTGSQLLGILTDPDPAQLPSSAGSDQVSVLRSIYGAIALWGLVGLGYVGGRWRDLTARMNFIRFTGEFIVYYGLIAIGGLILVSLGGVVFNALALEIPEALEKELIFVGLALPVGAVVVAAWLVEAKKQVIENIVPVLAATFTPICLIASVSFLIAFAAAGGGLAVDRTVLIAITGFVVVVFGLILYTLSARDATKPATLLDYLTTALVFVALIMDLIILQTMTSRIIEFGWSPNKVTTLVLNLLLVANLSWAGWQYVRFCRKKIPQAALEDWQTKFLPCFFGLAILVIGWVGFIPVTATGN